MSFLCRAISRIRGEDKQIVTEELPGRITGSDSIDTIVKIGLVKSTGLRPSARRVINQDFLACTDEELTVRRDEVVYILYRDHDWVYVSTPDGNEGFVPISFCDRQKGRRSTRLDAKNSCNSDTNSSNKESHMDEKRYICLSANTFPLMPTQDTKLIKDRHIKEECYDTHELSVSNALGASSNAFMGSMQSPKNFTPLSISLISLGKENAHFGKPCQTDAAQSFTPIPKSTLPLSKTSVPGLKSLEGLSAFRPFNKSTQPAESCFNTTLLLKKEDIGQLLVLFDFIAVNENDLGVRRGEIVESLNEEDREWTWVQRGDFLEGFVPYAYLCPLEGNFTVID